MTPAERFCKVAGETLREEGFSFNVATDITQDAAVLMAWRDVLPWRAVGVSASGLELVQNDPDGIEALAKSRAKNAMAVYNEARQQEHLPVK